MVRPKPEQDRARLFPCPLRLRNPARKSTPSAANSRCRFEAGDRYQAIFSLSLIPLHAPRSQKFTHARRLKPAFILSVPCSSEIARVSLANWRDEASFHSPMFSRLFRFFRTKREPEPTPQAPPETAREAELYPEPTTDDRPIKREPEPTPQVAPETACEAELHPEPATHDRSVDPALDDWKEGLPEDWEARRRVILDRDNFICQAPGCCWRAADIHHVVPRAQGGNHRADNLVALCRVHHAIVHLGTNVIDVKSYSSNRCTIVSRHWNRGALVPIHIRRFQRVTEAELKQIREHFGLKCRKCGSTAWEGHLRLSEYTIRIRCPGCNARWKLEAGLREETGAQLAMIFRPTQNVGRFAFDPKLIRGLVPS